jgi:hypothetical protein
VVDTGIGVFVSNLLKFPGSRVNKTVANPEIEITESSVLDMTQRIQDRQAEDRRVVKRVVLNEFISAHVFVAGRGLLKIHLKDINDLGLAFDITEKEGQFTRAEILEVRFYLNKQTYFKFHVQVAHSQFVAEEGLYRHGCQFSGDNLNNVALNHFVLFLQNISASLKTDKGDRLITNLYS